MKDYKTIREFDTDIAECKLKVWRILQEYDFESEITAEILSESLYRLLANINQSYRNEITENERLTN